MINNNDKIKNNGPRSKVSVPIPDDLSPITDIHTVKGEMPTSCFLTSTNVLLHVHSSAHAYTNTHKQIYK